MAEYDEIQVACSCKIKIYNFKILLGGYLPLKNFQPRKRKKNNPPNKLNTLYIIIILYITILFIIIYISIYYY